LISSPLNAPEQGGLVAGVGMDDQVIGDLFRHVSSALQVFTLDPALSKHLLAKEGRIEPDL
jgi:hypothetical protein